MLKTISALMLIIAAILIQQTATAGPEEDRLAFVAFYKERFPDIPVAEFANGIYAIDSDARDQWLDIEEFPPYEFAIEEGLEFWEEAFPDGSNYSDCFQEQTSEIRPDYPRFDGASGQVITLEMAINGPRTSSRHLPMMMPKSSP